MKIKLSTHFALLALLGGLMPAAHAQVFVNDTTSIYEYSYTGSFVRNVVTSGLSGAQNMTFGPDGMLYVADDAGGAIRKYNPDTGMFLGNVIAGLNRSTDCKFGPDGSLYVSEYGQSRVLKVNATTGAILQIYTGVNSALGLQFMTGGDLLATEGSSGGSIRRINVTTGSTTTFLTSTNIADVHLLPSGNYVFTDRSGSRLHQTTAAGISFTNFTTAGVTSFPYFMDNTATTLYVGSASSGVARYDLSSGALLGTFGPNAATGVAIRPTITASAPEPGTIGLLGLGLTFVGTLRMRRKRA